MPRSPGGQKTIPTEDARICLYNPVDPCHGVPNVRVVPGVRQEFVAPILPAAPAARVVAVEGGLCYDPQVSHGRQARYNRWQ